MSTYDSIPSSQVAASLGSGVGVSEVVSWQVSRSLSGGGLPQQARAVSGSSVGSGSVTLVPDAPGESPWSVNATAPGEAVSIDAAADVGAPLSPVARMVSRDVSADGWLSPARTLTIEDDIPRGRISIPNTPEVSSVEPSGVISQAAREMGLFATPPPPPGTVYSLPLVGSPWAEVGNTPDLGRMPNPVTYMTVDGMAMAFGDENGTLTTWLDGGSSMGTVAPAGAVGATLGVAFTAAFTHDFSDDSFSTQARLRLRGDLESGNPFLPLAVELGATSSGAALRFDAVGAGGGAVTVPLPAWVEPRRAHRYAVTWTGTSATTFAGRFHVHVDGERVTPSGGATLSTSIARLSGLYSVGVEQFINPGVQGVAINGLLLGHSANPADYGTLDDITARISSAGSPLLALAEPVSGDAWGVAQQVAAATLGAVWIDEAGHLTYRNRDQLRGDVPQYTIEALDHLEDVPWSISTDEIADRVEVTYRRPAVARTPSVAWHSTDVVEVGPGRIVTLDADIEGAGREPLQWARVEDSGSWFSKYAAWTAPPGESGSAPPASALDVATTMLSPSRIRTRIRNTTAATIWVYELTARVGLRVMPGQPLTVARGLPESKAQRPLQINAGSWVQDDTTAQQIAAWLESQSAMPLPTIPPVRVIPDESRRLGDVARVRIESIGDHEAVVFKALITSIDNSQSAGTYEQRIGFTILGVTFDDWQRWGEANGITTFDQLAAALSHLTTFDALDHWLTDLGGDL